MRIHRRDFLRQTGKVALAAGSMGVSGNVSARAEEDTRPDEYGVLPIVDTHQHLWDLTRLRLRWVKSSPVLDRSFLTSDYLEATRGLNVVKAVYMEVAVDPSQYAAEAEHVIGICRRDDNPTVAAVIGGDPASEGFRQYITRFAKSPYVKGVRHGLSRTDPGRSLDRTFVAGIRLLGRLGLSFDLNGPPARLPEAIKLVDQCPDTRFIVDHCGVADPQAFSPPGKPTSRRPYHDPDQWRRDMAAIAEPANVVCKISGIVSRADKDNWTAQDLAPIVNHCLDVFGPDRVMFGGDWPVCTRVATYRQWVEALKEIVQGRDEKQRRKLFHDNAAAFYGLT